MRNIITPFFALVFLFHSSSAQKTFTHFQESYPIVKGKLLGYDSSKDTTLTLKFVTVIPTPERQKEHLIEPQEDGSFEFQMEYPLHYQQIWFSIGNYYYGQLIVDQGLFIEADLEKLKKGKRAIFDNAYVKFKGLDGDLNHYINKYTIYEIPRRGDRTTWMDIMRDRKATPAEKTQKIRTIQKEKAEIEADFIAENPSPHAWILTNERLSDDYGRLMVIYWGHELPASLEKEILAHQPKVISNSGTSSYYGYSNVYYNKLNEKERLTYLKGLQSEISITSEKDRLASYISLLYQKIKGDTIDTKLFGKESRYFHKQYKSYYNQAVLNRFITVTADMPSEKSDMLKLLGGGRDIWERQNYVETIMPSLQSDWAKKIMQQEWDSVKDELAAAEARLNAITVGTVDVPIGESIGKLEGGADLFLANQASVDSLLASIRAVYPNKSILLDVWATWCGPCIHDMKNSAENIAQLRAMDVEVVYLCTTSGTEEEKWQQKVAELNLDATQIYLNDQLSKAIMKKFDLKGYPSHLLFDTKGKYIRDFHQNIMGVNFDELKELLD